MCGILHRKTAVIALSPECAVFNKETAVIAPSLER
jgi:hypothetical protein